MKNLAILVIGFLVHLVFLYSIFDIYFTSPLVHGMRHFRPGHLNLDNEQPKENKNGAKWSKNGAREARNGEMVKERRNFEPPAKRLVLFVADGLRADRAFEMNENGEPRMPFLRRMVEREGIWGVSHTRVPTESRPGHVALIAGFYEDVSAIAKGWKENPVDFDSVFNQSRYTWSWGSPDILPMFAKGATGDHVRTFTYPSESEDFAAADASKLDTWVFDKVKDFLEESRHNDSLSSQLRESGVVFFLHLLGIDVNGHSFRPNSDEYLGNIRLVDDGLEAMVMAVEDYYGYDGRTAYVFTADHGMTNWGSHGAGHVDETRTPLVVWGAGIKTPVRERRETDTETRAWKLDEFERHDVEQADVAALMTSLLGLNFPANSVGTVPVEILATSQEYKAECLMANLLEIHAQYQVKMVQKQSTSLRLFFKPFMDGFDLDDVTMRRRYVTLVQDGRYDNAMEYCRFTIKSTLKGLLYYHQYDRLFLGISIALGFVGWMAYVLILVLSDRSAAKLQRPVVEPIVSAVSVMTGVIGAMVVLFLLLQSLPLMYYVYCLTPVLLWHLVLKNFHHLRDTCSHLYKSGLCLKFAGLALCWVLGLEILVLSFFYREVLTVGLIALALYPRTTKLFMSDRSLVYRWFLCCVILAVFPLLPVVGRGTFYQLVLLAVVMTLVLDFCYNKRGSDQSKDVRKNNRREITSSVVPVQFLLLVLVLVIVYNTWSCLDSKQTIGLGWHLVSWAILVSTFVLPLLSSTRITERLYCVSLSLLALYYLLSIAHEGLFCLALCITLHHWIRVETQLTTGCGREAQSYDFVKKREVPISPSDLTLDDTRRAYTFIFFIMTSFYGTGNIASLNSFEPSSVYCFLTVFNPFVMGALLMLKIFIPFLAVACAFQAVLTRCQVRTRSLLLVVLLMSDFMGLHFFLLVRDYGSWLEIGTTISHYTIVMTMILALIVLMTAARGLLTIRIGARESPVHKRL